jgi:hypothetical protein
MRMSRRKNWRPASNSTNIVEVVGSQVASALNRVLDSDSTIVLEQDIYLSVYSGEQGVCIDLTDDRWHDGILIIGDQTDGSWKTTHYGLSAEDLAEVVDQVSAYMYENHYWAQPEVNL